MTLDKILPQIKKGVCLAEKTYFQLGGPTRYFLETNNVKELIEAVKTAKHLKIPALVLGGGSNVAVADRGWSGLVVKFHHQKPRAKTCQLVGREFICEASAPLAYLVRQSIRHRLAGLEKLAGIPGCVSGALVGNAGAYGVAISDHLAWVEIFDGQKIRRVDRTACHFGYRDSIFKHRPWVVLRAGFILPKGDQKILLAEARKIIKIRAGKYPVDLKCPGSFFKNIPVQKLTKKVLAQIDQAKIIEGKLPVAFLLESVGAKGERVGDMAVSDFHANFILNLGRGKFSDLKKLVAKLKVKVKKKFGIVLAEEVRYIG